jgi:hypothetical protein
VASISLILLVAGGLAGCGVVMVALVLVVWAIMEDRKAGP